MVDLPGKSKIDGRNFQFMLEELLTVRGVDTNPQELDSRDVKLMVDLSQGGFDNQNTRIYFGAEQPLAGLTNRTVTSPGTNAPLGTGRMAGGGDQGYDYMRIHTWTVKLSLDAAGMTFMDGKPVAIRWRLRENGLTSADDFYPHETEFTITDRGRARAYSFNIMAISGWAGFVPTNYSRWYEVESLDGTAFPVNTTVRQAEYKTVKRLGSWLPQ